MAIQFLYGGSGSGKTETLIKELLSEASRDLSGNFYLMVPEQDTLMMQKRIISHPENRGRGILNIDVLSFQRLAYRVFEERNQKLPSMIEDSGKIMILRRVAGRVKKELRFYQNQLDKPGFLTELKSQISEFYQYKVIPEMLREAAEHIDQALMKNKLLDLALLYQAFRDYMAEHQYMAEEELLDHLYRLLPESSFCQGASFYFDGYTGFTPMQLDVLEEMMEQAKLLLFSLSLRRGEVESANQRERAEEREMSLFRLSREAVMLLSEKAGKLGVRILPKIDVNQERYPRFRLSPALDYLERNLYRYQSIPVFPEELGGQIQFHEESDVQEEVRHTLRRIESRVRMGELRYRDIGILVTEPEEYRDLLFRYASEYHIPLFFDDRRSLLDSPYAEMLRASLEVLCDRFSLDAVIRYLRAIPTENLREQNAVDLLENYLRRKGMRGKRRYGEAWEEYEGLRQYFLLPLLRLEEKLKRRALSAEACIEGIREYLQEIRISEKLEKLIETLRQEGEQDRAEEFVRGREAVQELLLKMQELLGEEELSLPVFSEILDAGLQNKTVTVIPATLDQVMVGDLTRSRFSEIQLFFFLGMNSQAIPKSNTGERLLLDRERSFLKTEGIFLSPDKTETALEERFYLYHALTLSRRELHLSYSRKGRDGRGRSISHLLEEILKIFPEAKKQKGTGDEFSFCSSAEAYRLLSEALRSAASLTEKAEDERLLPLLSYLFSTKEEREKALRFFQAAFFDYREPFLSEETAKKLYHAVVEGSVTRIERFYNCAYAHFLYYGLKLREREKAELQNYDLGNFYHRAIEYSFSMALKEKRELSDYSDEEREQLLELAFSRAEAELEGQKFLDSERNQYLLSRMREVSRTTLYALSEQQKQGEFRLRALEKEFSESRGDMKIRGRVDRIDSYEAEDAVYLKLIDYKSGRKSFSLPESYDGVQLQLPLYMKGMLRLLRPNFREKPLLPAAMLYYHIDQPKLSYQEGMNEETVKQQRLEALKMDGLVVAEDAVVKLLDRKFTDKSTVIPARKKKDGTYREEHAATREQFEALCDYAEDKMLEAKERILSGEISMQPYQKNSSGPRGERQSACDYCEYHSVCGFDPEMEGYRYRRQSENHEILEKIRLEREAKRLKRNSDTSRNGERDSSVSRLSAPVPEGSDSTGDRGASADVPVIAAGEAERVSENRGADRERAKK